MTFDPSGIDPAIDRHVARGCAEKGLHGSVPAQAFFEGLFGEAGVGAQCRPLVRVLREGMDHVADAVDRGVEPRRQKGPDEALCLGRRAIATIRRLINLRAPAAGHEVFPLAAFHYSGSRGGGTGHCFFEQAVTRAKTVERGGAIGNEVFAPFRADADQVGEDRQRKGLTQIGHRVDFLAKQALHQRLCLGAPIGHGGLETG